MYKKDLVLNNLRWLICIKPNQTNVKNELEMAAKISSVIISKAILHKNDMLNR